MSGEESFNLKFTPRQRVTRDRLKEEPIVKEYIDTRKDKMYRDYMEPYICSASRPEKVLKLLREEGGVYRGEGEGGRGSTLASTASAIMS